MLKPNRKYFPQQPTPGSWKCWCLPGMVSAAAGPPTGAGDGPSPPRAAQAGAARGLARRLWLHGQGHPERPSGPARPAGTAPGAGTALLGVRWVPSAPPPCLAPPPVWLRPLPGSAPPQPGPASRHSPPPYPSPLSPGLGCSRPQPPRAPRRPSVPPEMFDDGSTNRGVTPTPQGQYPRPPTPGLAVGAHLGEKSLCAGEQMAKEIRLGVLVPGVQPHRKFSPASTGSRAARPRPGPVSGESAGHCPFSFSGGIHPTPWLNPFWCLEPQSYPSSHPSVGLMGLLGSSPTSAFQGGLEQIEVLEGLNHHVGALL